MEEEEQEAIKRRAIELARRHVAHHISSSVFLYQQQDLLRACPPPHENPPGADPERAKEQSQAIALLQSRCEKLWGELVRKKNELESLDEQIVAVQASPSFPSSSSSSSSTSSGSGGRLVIANDHLQERMARLRGENRNKGKERMDDASVAMDVEKAKQRAKASVMEEERSATATTEQAARGTEAAEEEEMGPRHMLMERLAMLELKKLQLVAEVEQAKKDTTVETESEEVLKARYVEMAKEDLKQLNETMSYMRDEIEYQRARLAREQQRERENKIIHEQLSAKLAQQEEQASKLPPNPIASRMQQLLAKKKHYEQQNSRWTRELIRFIDTYYPVPDNDDASSFIPSSLSSSKRNKKKGEGEEETTPQEKKKVLALKVLLQHLMVKCQTKEEAEDDLSSYMDVSDEAVFWPPYVELLVRSGVVQKHPEDGRLIRLVQFQR